ncbi:TPA: hypothetical protein QDZ84_003484 [Shewanella algae]|uniref:hypothetical protein n=1 Tax=Shewanella TaxID=22 RepID=UPI001431C652|nr:MULTISPECIES: hypothetical protein [Shewanella]NJI86951.1 hypothetical protein [Shewanella sp. Iso12]HDS1208445.1 hypothetical protein [Shewanella algae]
MLQMNGKRQKGYSSVIGILIVLTFLSIALVEYGKLQKLKSLQDDAERFASHVKYIRQQVIAYQSDRVSAGAGLNDGGASWFPNSWADLEGKYVNACSTADNNAGKCRKASQTPWGGIISFQKAVSPGMSHYQLKLIIPIPKISSTFRLGERQSYLAALGGIPGTSFNSVSSQVIVLVDRIGQELQHEALLARSGDTTLLGDWDVGGSYAITNTRDITIRNSDGSQRSLAAGLPVMVVHHGERINKHKCPSGFSPDAIASIKGIYNRTEPNLFSGVSSSRAYVTAYSAYWIAGLDYWANVKGKPTLLHDGEIKVELVCK